MKNFLVGVLLTIGLSLSAQSNGQVEGQINGRLITHHTEVQDMVWSKADEKFVYIVKQPRHPEHMLIESNMNVIKETGRVVITSIADSKVYIFNVFGVEFKEGPEYNVVTVECIEADSGNKCTIIYVKSINSEQMVVSVMLPESELAVYFDNLED